MCSTLRKCGTYRTEVAECHDHGSPFQGRKKGGNSFRDNSDKRNCHHEHGGYERPSSHCQENDGSVEMRDVHKDQQLRHTPYSIRCDRRMKWHSEDEICITTWRNRKPPGRKMRQNTQDGYTRNWFKVTIPYGIKYDKSWLMNSIQSHCSAPFTPVDFHYIRNRACFFVQDATTASVLKDVSYKICDDENRKVCVEGIPLEGQSQGSVLAFTRTFIATPGGSSSLCIVNDELFVRDASPQETQSAFSIPVSTLSSSSEPSLSQEQQEMVQAFSAQSGMKLEWSQKCLQDNEWNYTRAGQVFTMLQTEGKIPAEAFKQIS
ncbi:PREDICTED: nuclear RNA export factor 2 [Cercocebus atys]|uniref:nuclear RNA export factor 2 n=1 Tax=Cercocebus atys TaxID=9531 RepID=UPI0005F533EE|nr:PREDICTED: nuclear RNA export factor 2 [Cercocebus atys]